MPKVGEKEGSAVVFVGRFEKVGWEILQVVPHGGRDGFCWCIMKVYLMTIFLSVCSRADWRA